MKKLDISVLFFLSIILLSLPSLITKAKITEYPELYTRITMIDWEYVTIYPDITEEDVSFFNFTIEYELLNLNETSYTITFPHCNLFFEANISAVFQNPEITTIPYTPIGLCSDTNILIKEGLTTGVANYRLIFQDPSIIILPDGEYDLWIYGYSIDNVISSVSKLIIDGTDIKVIYEDFMTENVEIHFVTVVFTLLLSSIFFIFIMKMKSRRS